jgi:phosphatidylserine/phosphatidylglycerophosphate/cardiolipin synthase-like enzyme
MLTDINQAQHYILLEMYLVKPGLVCQRFFEAFHNAVQRGVTVHILLDAFGSSALPLQQIENWRDSGIQLALYNPIQLKKHALAMFRDHRKLMVVDGQIAYVGGAGLMDEFDSPAHPENNWRENMVRIEGANVGQWQTLFADNWQHWSDQQLQLRHTPEQDFDGQGRVAMTRGPQFLEIKRSFLNHVRSARGKVWLCTAYFVPSRKLRRALRRTARRGVDVRILLPGAITDLPMVHYIAQRYYTRLLSDGVRIFEFQQRFMHAKLVLCDNWVSIGSCNIDRWNLHWNLDANQEIRCNRLIDETITMFENDFSCCQEITLEQWKNRSSYRRFAIWFWSVFAYVAEKILVRRHLLRYWRELRKSRKGN